MVLTARRFQVMWLAEPKPKRQRRISPLCDSMPMFSAFAPQKQVLSVSDMILTNFSSDKSVTAVLQ